MRYQDWVDSDEESLLHSELVHQEHPERAPRCRRRKKKVALAQTILILTLALWQQKRVAEAGALSDSKAGNFVDAVDNEMRGDDNVRDGASADETEGKVQEGFPSLDLDPYYNHRFVYREDAESTEAPSMQNEDILVVAAVDGTIAGISRSTGETLWRRSHYDLEQQNHLKTQKDLSEAPLFEPLLSTTTTTTSSTTSEWRTSAVPSIDGIVHLTAPLYDPDISSDELLEDQGDVTVSTSTNELSSRVPFVDNRGRIYTGSRKSIAVAIDVNSGEVLHVVSADSECSNPFFEERQVVWLGRVDQTISIQDPRSGGLDVRFSSGQIMSVNDMVLGTGTRQPWNSNELISTLFSQDGEDSRQQPVLLATPNGILASMDRETGRVGWIAEDFYDSPVAFAVDAGSGASLTVNIIPDATMPNGSTDYLTREIERQLKFIRSTPESLSGDKKTIFGTLPSGQLYAMPIGGLELGGTASPARSHLQQAMIDSGSKADQETRSWTAPPIGKAGCRPGTLGFPACLIATAEHRDPFSRPLDERFVHSSTPPLEDSAVVPFYHPDFGYIPPEHFYTLNQNPQRHKYKKLLRILGSWLLPTIAFIFVVSFELGRRKKENDSRHSDTDASEVLATNVDGNAGSNRVIEVYDDVILGYGGHGTVVYKGMLDGRQVAVKRMLKTYNASADREISLLIESDGHPNVVRYFLKEIRGDFVYLALELCDLSLHDLIATLQSHFDHKNFKRDLLPPTKSILYQIASGVRHLHHLRIVHRDLKPENVLMSASNRRTRKGKQEEEAVFKTFSSGQYVAKISDMGLSKQLVGQSSFGASLMNNASLRGQSNGAQSCAAGAGPGSVGWQAPEVMARRLPSDASVRSDGSNVGAESISDSSPSEMPSNARTSRSVDVFSLGCIFHSTLIPGSHPFGEWYEREANIMHNRPCIDTLKELSPDAHDLVSGMIQRSPAVRPTAQQICEHPFFWSDERRLTFLCDFSDRLEMETDQSEMAGKFLIVEQGASQVVGTSWDRDLDDDLLSNVQRFRSYDPSSVRDLLRLIRNKHHHFDELPVALRRAIASESGGLLRYFEQRFPNLLIHCYRVCKGTLARDDPLAVKYSIAQNRPLSRSKRVNSEVPPCSDEAAEQTVQPLKTTKDEEANGGNLSIAALPKRDPGLDGRNRSTGVNVASDECIPAKRDAERSLVETDDATRSDVGDVIIWHGSTAAKTLVCRGWNRSDGEWERCVDTSLRRRDGNLIRCAKDPKFRTRLCNHWDTSYGTFCPMMRKNKCVFAHGPVQLRVKETKRKRWGKLVDANGDCLNPNHSGGEDTYGAARSIESERRQEGKWNMNKTLGRKGKSKAHGSNRKVMP